MDGIYDDGEWISWEQINHQLYKQEAARQFPHGDFETVEIFESLILNTIDYFEITGRYLQIWGELGELFAEIKYGLDRHIPGFQGSDGRIGNDWVEVKTISPMKKNNTVQVKRAGNFNKLIIVKINDKLEFRSRVIERQALGKGEGKYARYTWKDELSLEKANEEEWTFLKP